MRNHSEPTESIMLNETNALGSKKESKYEKTFGGTCLEYNVDAGPTRYLVGTEQGIVFSCNKKPKKPVDVNQR